MQQKQSIAEVPAYFSELGRLRMLGGDAALDFANTRHLRDGAEIDFLTGYPALIDWAVVAGLLSQGEHDRLRAAEGAMPLQTADVFSATVRLRDTWKIYLGEATRTEPPALDQPLEALRRMVTKALGEPDLAIAGLPMGTLSGTAMALPLAGRRSPSAPSWPCPTPARCACAKPIPVAASFSTPADRRSGAGAPWSPAATASRRNATVSASRRKRSSREKASHRPGSPPHRYQSRNGATRVPPRSGEALRPAGRPSGDLAPRSRSSSAP